MRYLDGLVQLIEFQGKRYPVGTVGTVAFTGSENPYLTQLADYEFRIGIKGDYIPCSLIDSLNGVVFPHENKKDPMKLVTSTIDIPPQPKTKTKNSNANKACASGLGTYNFDNYTDYSGFGSNHSNNNNHNSYI